MSHLRNLVAAAAAIVGLLGGAAQAGTGGRNSLDLARGERTYLRYCATCHGEQGDGNGASARHLAGMPPRDFVRENYKFRSTPSGQPPTDEDIARTIRQGLGGTTMPAWRHVLDEKRTAEVVVYIKSFSKTLSARREEPPEVVRIPEPPPSSRDSVWRGRQIYLVMKCWQCHGLTGKGDGPSVPTLKDGKKRPIVPPDLNMGRFKGGNSASEIYRAFVTGLDGTPMPSYAETMLLFRGPKLLAGLDKYLRAGELQWLREFADHLPTAESFYASSEAERARLVEGWRWDLVHYMRSLLRRRLWRGFLGL